VHGESLLEVVTPGVAHVAEGAGAEEDLDCLEPAR